MSTFATAILIMTTIAFLIWAFLFFRALWGISIRVKQKADKTGEGYINWAGNSFSIHMQFLFGQGPNPERRRLIIWTIILAVLIIGFSLTVTRESNV